MMECCSGPSTNGGCRPLETVYSCSDFPGEASSFEMARVFVDPAEIRDFFMLSIVEAFRSF